MNRNTIWGAVAGVVACAVASWTLAGTASLLLGLYHATQRPHTYHAAVVQVLKHEHIPQRTLEVVAVCPSESEVCLGWHVNLSTGAAPPTYGWIACRPSGDRCRFSLPAHGLHALALPTPAGRAVLAANDPTAAARGTGALGTARRRAAGGPLTASTAHQGSDQREFSCVGRERRRSINATGSRRNRRTARRRPGTPAHQAASHGGGHRRHRARDERSLPRSSRSGSAGAHAGIAPSGPPDTRCGAAAPLINHCRGAAATVDERGRSTAKRRPVCRRLPLLSIASSAASPPAEPAADQPRRDRAVQGSARQGRAQRALAGAGSAWQAQAGSGGRGGAARDGQRAGRRRASVL